MLLLAILLLVLPTNESGLLTQSRELFFNFNKEECAPEKLFDLLEKTSTDEPVIIAYKGAARASSAECAFMPNTKLKRFNEGKKLLSKAVELDPKNAEIRFLRLSVQAKAPSFLGYNENIAEDKNIVLNALADNFQLWQNKAFTLQVISFLQENVVLSDQESGLLQQLTLKLKNQ